MTVPDSSRLGQLKTPQTSIIDLSSSKVSELTIITRKIKKGSEDYQLPQKMLLKKDIP